MKQRLNWHDVVEGAVVLGVACVLVWLAVMFGRWWG